MVAEKYIGPDKDKASED